MFRSIVRLSFAAGLMSLALMLTGCAAVGEIVTTAGNLAGDGLSFADRKIREGSTDRFEGVTNVPLRAELAKAPREYANADKHSQTYSKVAAEAYGAHKKAAEAFKRDLTNTKAEEAYTTTLAVVVGAELDTCMKLRDGLAKQIVALEARLDTGSFAAEAKLQYDQALTAYAEVDRRCLALMAMQKTPTGEIVLFDATAIAQDFRPYTPTPVAGMKGKFPASIVVAAMKDGSLAPNSVASKK